MSLYIVKNPLLPSQILCITILRRGDAQLQQAIGPGSGKRLPSPWRGEGPFLVTTPGMVTGMSHGATDDNFPSIQLSDNQGSHSLPEKMAGLPDQHWLLPGMTLPGDTSVQLPVLIFCSHILRFALQGAITKLEGKRTCQNPPAWGNPSYCSPEKPCLSDLGE